MCYRYRVTIWNDHPCFRLFQILKRFNHDWNKMEEEIKHINGPKTLKALNRVKNSYGGGPTEGDLQGAARALNRLQSVYR